MWQNLQAHCMPHILLLMHLPPHMVAAWLTGHCLVVADWRPFSLFSSSPGYDYRSHKTCGLSVGVKWAEYCLNRNSYAALYPDVANRMCVRGWGGWWGVCRVLDWFGHVVELSRSSSGMGLIIIFLSQSIVMMQSVFSLHLPEIMNMQKNCGVKVDIRWRGNPQVLGLVTWWWLIALRAHLQYFPS